MTIARRIYGLPIGRPVSSTEEALAKPPVIEFLALAVCRANRANLCVSSWTGAIYMEACRYPVRWLAGEAYISLQGEVMAELRRDVPMGW
jgi:hypothetical protein